MSIVLPGGVAKAISSMSTLNPLNQRLILGVSALPMMTSIDYLNPYVDKETRKTSAIRTAIKTIICTGSGLLSRYLGGKLGENLVKNGAIKLPKGIPQAIFTKRVGDVFMVLAGIVSVFAIDIPFINKILNAVMKNDPHSGHGSSLNNSSKTGINHIV